MKYPLLMFISLLVSVSICSMEPLYPPSSKKKADKNDLANLVLFSMFHRGSYQMTTVADHKSLKKMFLTRATKAMEHYPIQKNVSCEDLTLILNPRILKRGGGYDYALFDTHTWYRDGWVSAIDINPHEPKYMAYALMGPKIYIDSVNGKTEKNNECGCAYTFCSVSPQEEKKISISGGGNKARVLSIVYDTLHKNRLFSATQGYNYISVHNLDNKGTIIEKISIDGVLPIRSLLHMVTSHNTPLLFCINDAKYLSAIVLNNQRTHLGTILLAGLKDKRSILMNDPEHPNKILIWHPEGYHIFLFKL